MQLSINSKKDSGITKQRKKESTLIWYVFLLPVIIGIVVFMVYPVLDSFRLSFFASNGVKETFVGLGNYTTLMKEQVFWKSLYNTFFMAICQVAIAVPLGFVIAVFINNLPHFKDLFKVLFFMPYITSLIAASMVFMYLFHPSMGPINYLLNMFGLPSINWLSQPNSARWAIVILGVWNWIGFVVVICIANLQTIPAQLYEASEIDGANAFQKFLYITIPKMMPTFSFLLIMGFIRTLQRFGETYTIGGAEGSPMRSLYTIVGFIYDRGFGGTEYGLAAAAAYVLFMIIMVITFINMKVSKMKV